MKAITKRKPHKYGSIKEESISEMELIEYRQTGMIRVKESPVSRGELKRLKSHKESSYYDWAYRQTRWIEDIWMFKEY